VGRKIVVVIGESLRVSAQVKAQVTAGLPSAQKNFVLRFVDLLREERKNWRLSQVEIGVPPLVLVFEREKRRRRRRKAAKK
jgi:hypothetical protein